MSSANYWIQALGLERHPEGGWYREIYRSQEMISGTELPDRFSGDRCFSTAIYFLLASEDISAFHRIQQDEIWHFYDGTGLTLQVIHPDSSIVQLRLGRNVTSGESLVHVVPAGSLFGGFVDAPDSYCLAGCTVAPGFDFADFEMPSRRELLQQYPQHREWIDRLTNPQ